MPYDCKTEDECYSICKQAGNCHISAISRKRGGKYLCSYTLCVPSPYFNWFNQFNLIWLNSMTH